RWIAGQPGESRANFPVAVDDGVERQRDRSEGLLLKSLLLLVDRSFAVGEKPGENESIELGRHIRPTEDVRLHPAAIRAGIPGKIDEDKFAGFPRIGY